MLAGTMNGKDWGFYFDDKKEELEKYVEISDKEHKELMDGQSQGKAIVFHEDGKPTLEEPPELTNAQKAQRRIGELKAYLLGTDYVAIKIAEGAAAKEDYAEILEERRKAHKEIGALEKIAE